MDNNENLICQPNFTSLNPSEPPPIEQSLTNTTQNTVNLCEKNGLNDIGKERKNKPQGYWTKELCQMEAFKFNEKMKFKHNSGAAYTAAIKNKWLLEICKHMSVIRHHWTFDECKKEASKYGYLRDFMKSCPNQYDKARKEKWLDLICSHMKSLGNRYQRMVYVYEFLDNSVYVGITYDEEDRKNGHLVIPSRRIKSSVYKHFLLTNTQPTYKKISDYIDVEIAKIMEGELVKSYKENGWKILNRAKTGGVGGTAVIWSKENVAKEALKHKTRTDFQNVSRGAYLRAHRDGYLNEVCSHMKFRQLPNGHWLDSKDNCHAESSKYKNKTDFQKNSPSAYNAARKRGWLDEICGHMEAK